MIRVHLQLVCDECGTPIDVTARFDWMASTKPDLRPVSEHAIVKDRFSLWRVANGRDVACGNCVARVVASDG